MKIRCKVQLSAITESAWSTSSKELKFSAFYDQSIPEDQRFAKATPSAQFTMQVDNPSALDHFKLGAFYYVDFDRIEPAP